VHCIKHPFTLFVIPDLIRNPGFLNWIPAFAGMTAFEIMLRNVRRITLGMKNSNTRLRLRG
jgi:hypothetical protein